MNKKADMVDINKEYVKERIKAGGFHYVDLAKIMGKTSKGSLTCAISSERMSAADLKMLARIVNFPYEDAIRHDKPKAYVIKKCSIKDELDQIVSLQKEINSSLIRILKEI